MNFSVVLYRNAVMWIIKNIKVYFEEVSKKNGRINENKRDVYFW